MRHLLVVPGLFCTELYDEELGHIWGRFWQLYGGPPIGTLDGVRGGPRGILRALPLLFGFKYDLLGALEAGAGRRRGTGSARRCTTSRTTGACRWSTSA